MSSEKNNTVPDSQIQKRGEKEKKEKKEKVSQVGKERTGRSIRDFHHQDRRDNFFKVSFTTSFISIQLILSSSYQNTYHSENKIISRVIYHFS